VSRPALRIESLETRLTPAFTQFAVIGDFGLAGANEAAVAALVNSWNPDYVITTGDNNYQLGQAATIDANIGQYYHQYIGNYTGTYGAGSAVNRFFPSLGNHDWVTRSGTPPLPTPYLDYFTLPGNERYYTFTQGPVQFFAIDSGDATGTDSDGFEPDGITSTSVQGQWLQTQLALSTAQWRIVYLHHAPYSSGEHGNTPVMQWPFQQWGATAVLSGHEHDYERVDVNGFPYIVNGLGGESEGQFGGTPIPGSQIFYNADFGAMKVVASETSMQFQFINVAGQVIDTYTINAANFLPTVSVAATPNTASEAGIVPGAFTITRTGSTAAPLTVSLAAGGTATSGDDYVPLPTTVTIPAGASAITVQVTPIDDTIPENSETVTLTVGPNSAYNVGAANTATVTILDNDSSVVNLVPVGAVWKYRDNGTDQGTAWRVPAFDDGAWASGPAELGYGDGDEATVVGFGPDPNNKYITTYFRRSFNVTDAAAVLGMKLRLLRDDGAVVYLNGTEVYRSNVGAGPVTSTTLAPLSLGQPDESTFVLADMPSAGLVNGTNVLAVEVHQASPNSSDISFNLGLDATVNTLGTVPPTVAGVQVNDGASQRSEVRSLKVTFSGPVSFANNNPTAAFALTRVSGPGGGVVLNAAPATNAAGQTVVTLTFTGGPATDPVSGQNGGALSVADGRYQLSILDGAVTGAGGVALDGDNDGTAGGAYQSPADTAGSGAGYRFGLYRLFGDVNGDGTDDAFDAGAVRVAFNSFGPNPPYLAYLDANNDGTIDAVDVGQFRVRFNTNLFP
jgi:tartrate-resistant acid phosphatase type 5